MITNQIIETGVKLLFIYISVLILFYKITHNNPRLFATLSLFITTSYLFNVPYHFAIFYLFMSSGAAFSEHLVSNMKNTWIYKNTDIGLIPYWLIPLWGIAIIIIIEAYKVISVVRMPI